MCRPKGWLLSQYFDCVVCLFFLCSCVYVCMLLVLVSCLFFAGRGGRSLVPLVFLHQGRVSAPFFFLSSLMILVLPNFFYESSVHKLSLAHSSQKESHCSFSALLFGLCGAFLVVVLLVVVLVAALLSLVFPPSKRRHHVMSNNKKRKA